MTLTLIFRSDDRVYGLEIDSVQEIIEGPHCYEVPRAAPFLKGAVNVHGDVLPLIDLSAMMGCRDVRRDARKVVLAPDCRGLVLEVSRIERIVTLDLEPAASSVPADEDRFCRLLVGRNDEPPVRMLDLKTVFTLLEQVFLTMEEGYALESNDRR